MPISRIELMPANVPLKRPFRIAIGETVVTDTVFVRIHTQDGLYGMGEANTLRPVVGESQATALAAGRDLAHLLLGRDPLAINTRANEMRAFLPHNTTIRSAFDMALHDIAGKTAGLPLYRLLGGEKRTLVTDNTAGLDTPQAMAEHAHELVARGFPAIKVKLGTNAPDDIARVRAIRAAIGPDVSLRLDANQGWDRATARSVLDAVKGLGVAYCEQPLPRWDIEGLAALAATAPVPIMADEALFDAHDALALVSRTACDYLNIKLAKSGGLCTALEINAIAEAGGHKCMVGCMTETRLGLTAAAHLASARPNIAFADLDGADMLAQDPVTGGMAYGPQGTITLPDTPGLGADLEPDFAAGLETITISQ